MLWAAVGDLEVTGDLLLTGDEKEMYYYEGSNYLSFAAPSSLAADYTFTWPADDGTSGQVLITDGSGALSWSTVSGGGGGDMFVAVYDTDADGDIDVAAGGTEKSSWTQYCIPYLSNTTVFGEIGIGTADQYLQVNSGATGYQWDTLTLADIDLTSWTGSTSITTLGTISTGTWAATDVGLAHGGTGASLSDPGADRLMGWDDSGTTVAWFVPNNYLTTSTTNLNVDLTGWTGSTDITTLGTIATGTWNGTAIADAYVDDNITLTNITQITSRAHNDLASLQGGTTNEYYHLTYLEERELTRWLDDVTLSQFGALTLPSTQAFKMGTTQWNIAGNIDGEVIRDNSIDEDSLDFGDITLADFTDDLGADPGHTHTTTSVSGIDISDDTDLAAGDGLTLTDDTLSADLGTAIDTTEITDATIAEVDLKAVDAASDEEILTYELTTGDFEWHTPAELITAGTALSWSGSTLNAEQLSQESLEDYVGQMVTGNTETLITVTYQDGDGTLDFVVEDNLSLYDWTSVVVGDLPSTVMIEGENISLFNNDSGYITSTLTQEEVEDYIGGIINDPDSTQTRITVTYDDTDNALDFVVDDLGATLTQEEVEDYAGAMVTGNTETLITVTYQDADGTVDYVVDNDLHNYDWTNVDGTDLKTGSVTQAYDADLDDLADGTLSKSKVQDSANWDTAYGWGDHSGQGYLTASPFGATIDDTELTAEDFGDITASGAEDGVTIDSGVVDSDALADTAVTPGSYTFASFTVDADGRLTAANSGTDDDQPDNDGEVPDDITVTGYMQDTDVFVGEVIGTYLTTDVDSNTIGADELDEAAEVEFAKLTVDDIIVDYQSITTTTGSNLTITADGIFTLESSNDDIILLTAAESIDLKPSGDDTDHFRFDTVDNVPWIDTVGACDLKITASGGDIDFDNTDLINVDIDTGTIDAAVTQSEWDGLIDGTTAISALHATTETTIETAIDTLGAIACGAITSTDDASITVTDTTGDGVLVDASTVTTGKGLRVEVDGATFLAAGHIIEASRDNTAMFYVKEWGACYAAGGFEIASGSAAQPAIRFTGDTDTGVYRKGADNLGMATAGTLRLEIGSGGEVYMAAAVDDALGNLRDAYWDSTTGQIGYDSSSVQDKTNIEDLDQSGSVLALRPRKYLKGDVPMWGLVAEEVKADVGDTIPNLISYKVNKVTEEVLIDPNEWIDGDVPQYQTIVVETQITDDPATVNYSRLIVPMLKEIQNLNARITALEAEVEKLKQR
jgi:hypothetical protein